MTIQHACLAILVAIIWGLNFIFVKMGVHDIPPIFLCALRFLFASVPAIFFIKWPNAPFKLVALYGLVMYGLQFTLIFSGLAAGMTAGLASIIVQSQIFFSIFFAVLFLGEKTTYWQIIGCAIAFSGIMLVGLHLDHNISWQGLDLVMSGAAVWGIGNLITKRLTHVNKLGLVVWGSFISFPPLLLISFLVEGQDKIVYGLTHFSSSALISLVYIVYVSTWAGYGLWSWLLSRYPVSLVVPFTLLVPVFGMLSSILVLNESFEPWKLHAAILVIAGLIVNLFGTKVIKSYRRLKLRIKSQ